MKDKYIVEFNEKEIGYLSYTMSKHLFDMEQHEHWGKKDLTLLKNLVSKISKQKHGRG